MAGSRYLDRPDALPVTQPAVSKHRKDKYWSNNEQRSSSVPEA